MTESASPPVRIFISYRRKDPTADPGRIQDYLEQTFGSDNVFRDSHTLVPGRTFPQEIEAWLQSATVVVAVIGERWAREHPQDPDSLLLRREDWIRQELELAKEGKKPIIPIRFADAASPAPEELPESLAFIRDLHALHLPLDVDFRGWTEELKEAILDGHRNTKASTSSSATAADFRRFASDYLQFKAEGHDVDAICKGFAELYAVRFDELRDRCLGRNSFTLLEGRRGIGKSFLLRRLHEEAARTGNNRTLAVSVSWDTLLVTSSADDDDLQTKLATLLLWGIASAPSFPDKLSQRWFGPDRDLYEHLATRYQERPALTAEAATGILHKAFPELDPSRVADFARKVAAVSTQFRRLKDALLENGIHRILLFIDDFTERITDPAIHDLFFRLLHTLRNRLNPEVDCTITVGIYPFVTSLSEFRDGHDGQIIRLQRGGPWSEWHRKIAQDLIFQQFNVFCAAEGLPRVNEAACTELRNTFFEGNAVKRLSFLANRSPRQYTTLLQQAVAGLEGNKVSSERLSTIAKDEADRQYIRIHTACQQYPLLDVEPKVAVAVFDYLLDWIRFASLERQAKGLPRNLCLELDRQGNQGVLNHLRLLAFLGLINLQESSGTVLVELSPLFGLSREFVVEADLDAETEPFPVRAALMEAPFGASAEHPKGLLPNPTTPQTRNKRLSDFQKKRLSDKHFGFDPAELRDRGLSSATVADVVTYSPIQGKFRTLSSFRGTKLPKRTQRMIEAGLQLYIAKQRITILDDSESTTRPGLLATPIEKLGLSGSCRKKLQRAGITKIEDLVAEYADSTGYRFNEPKVRKAGLSENEKRAVSARVGEILSDFRINRGLTP